MTPTAKRIHWSEYTTAQRRTADNPDAVFRVYHAPTIAAALADGRNVQDAIHEGEIARVHVRWTNSASGSTCHVLTRVWSNDDTETAHYYGTAGGYGYDKRTAAMQGMPITHDGPCFTDHCGLDRQEHTHVDKDGRPMREITLDRMPAGYFVIGG